MKIRCKLFFEYDSKFFYGFMNLELCIEYIKLFYC